MSESTEEERIRQLAAAQLVGFMRVMQIASLRLRCAEIIWTNGSQEHRGAFESHAERLYRFATQAEAVPAPEKKIDARGNPE